MKIIGLTGGIGSGKSTVARMLAELGAAVIDMDKMGHQALELGGKAWQPVVDAFGEGILGPGREIDRARLGNIVFKDHAALLRLNAIVHPEIDRIVAEKISEYRRNGVKVVMLEAAAMLEAEKTAQVEEIWVTTAPEKVVIRRISERGGLSEPEARSRIRAQLTNEERIKHANVVINTDCSLDELKARVMVEWQKLIKRL